MGEEIRPMERSWGPDSFLAAQVAWLHFKEHKTNLTIAEELGISRFRVARLLEQAMTSGLVEVKISRPIAVNDTLGEQLRTKFGLSQALVLAADSPPGGNTTNWTRRGIAEVAARYMADVLKEGGKFGVSWGHTLDDVAAALAGLPNFPKCDVVQLVGGLPTVEDSLHASEVLRRFADVARGKLYPLHAPMFVPDAQTASGLKAEDSVQRTLGMVRELDVAVVGVGTWAPPTSHMVRVLPKDAVATALEQGAAADVCAVVLDAEGQEVGGDITDRMMRARLQDLRQVPIVIAVGGGADKAPGLQVILPSGIVDVLVTDAATAGALLA